MNIHLLILCTLVACLLEKHSLQASEELESNIQELSSPTHTTSFMTHQMVVDQLSKGLFFHKKLRIQIALAPATQEYLTEEFMTVVQNFTQEMNIFEKCYVIRAMIRIPVSQLTTLRDILTVKHTEHLQALPNSERVSFIKKLKKIEPNQWQHEIASVFVKHHK